MDCLLDWVNSLSPFASVPALCSPKGKREASILTPETKRLGVVLEFLQTLLKKLPDCIDGNHVRTAFSIAKVIIEMNHELGDNKDELVKCVEETAKRLLAVERTIGIGIPNAAEQEMKKLEQILEKEMRKLKDLAFRLLAIQTLDHDEDKKAIQNIFQCINDATMAFQVGVANSIQRKANMIHDDIKKATLKRLHPSEMADHRTLFEQLKHEGCTAGTRVKVIDDITKWAIESSSDSPCVFWLTGQAGSGKTTVSCTIARHFEKVGNTDQSTVLGGSFLCSRQFEETQQPTRIIPTIAYQLAHKCKSYADALHVANEFDAVDHHVANQLKDLLIGPWQQSEPTRHPELPRYLIVIDGLDELKGNGETAFLRDLLTAIDEYDLKNLKFLVTSRSNSGIVKLSEPFASCHLQDLPIEEAKPDVELYLKERLKELDGRPELDELVRRAGGLFVYAATVVRHLTLPGSVTVEKQIEVLKELFSEPASASDTTLLINGLYQQIMWHAFAKSRRKRKGSTRRLHVLYTFLCTGERISPSVAAALVPGGDNEAVGTILHDFRSILYTHGNQVFWYHPSFTNFIFTPTWSNFRIGEDDFAFSCNEQSHHRLLTESCFRIMESGLRFNMGNISSSFLFDHDNTTLSEQVNRNIDTSLRYSSRYWTHHLASTKLINNDDLCRCISDFLQIRVLFWIEAMNLLGFRDQCTPILQRARQWVLKCRNNYLELSCDLDEAVKFAIYFTESPAAESTPHLYISALATWSQTSSLCQKWRKSFSRIPRFTGPQLPAVDGHTCKVTSVVFSTDGTQIISGSEDRSVRMWDAHTGVQMQVFKGHTNGITSVAFWSDGTQYIVSGSDNESVRVWDVTTGVQLAMLYNHSCKVNSIAFSPDGTRIASGSHDNLVRIWDIYAGVEMQALKGHTGSVTSITFSPDGTRIISGSNDKSVRIWDVPKGLQVQVLNGHTLEVSSVAISPDGTRITSGSHDKSVRVWDGSTGVQLQVIKRHIDWVTSVAFSPNGARIVSGSRDQSVRIWNASTGVQVQMFRGHTHYVTSVSFSCDGMDVVSGSDDKSICVWRMPKPVEPKKFLWTRTPTNWIISSPGGDHLMWVPKVARLTRPFNTLIISDSGFVTVDFDQSMMGDSWVECYTP